MYLIRGDDDIPPPPPPPPPSPSPSPSPRPRPHEDGVLDIPKNIFQSTYTRFTVNPPMSLDELASNEELNFVGFNQDATSVTVGGPSGYSLYSTKQVEKLDVIYESHGENTDDKKKNLQVSDVMLIERLFSSSLLMLVSIKAPRKLRIYHFQKNNEICAQSYTNTVLSVKLNREHMVVCLETVIYIHTVKDMKVIHSINYTPPNPAGIIDLSPTVNSYIAYPMASSMGHVQIYDATRILSVVAISAHTSPLAAVRFSYDGKKLATASTRGTVIRVFNTESGDRLFEFTRGVKRYVTIYSLAFSIDGNYLCSSSNTETVHVFKLEKPPDTQNQTVQEDALISRPGNEQEQGWVDYLSKQASTYIPTQMNDLWMRAKSIATARLPTIGKRSAVALPVINGKLHLLVATTDGYLYVYIVEPEGGELALVRQHKVGIKTPTIVHAHDPPENKNKSNKNVPENAGGGSGDGRREAGGGGGGGQAAMLNADDFPPLNHSTE